MTDTDPDALLQARGIISSFAAQITACVFNRPGTHAAFALGDGTIRITDQTTWQTVPAHHGAVLTLAQDCADGFISGGDDGNFNHIAFETSPAAYGSKTLAAYGMKWVDHTASWAGPKSTALLACSVGKNLHLFTAAGEPLRSLPHPSTVTGIAFDAKGKRIAASHYNGASLWFTAASTPTPKLLSWKGSHTGIALHPGGEALVTTMQENALHGWTLPEAKHMRMSGYPSKTESLGFTRSGKYLATGGADAIVLWPFFGGGPMGKAPLELAASNPPSFLKRIACHPEHEIIAAGFEDGSVIAADIPRNKILPIAASGRGSITALTWNPSGSHLAFGTTEGFTAIVDFS